MKRILFGFAALVGLFAATGSSAQAQQWGYGGGQYGGYGCGTTPAYGFANPYGNYGGGYSSSGGWGFSTPQWNNTTRFDYQRSTYMPHGNHFGRQPAHYDPHRSGHPYR